MQYSRSWLNIEVITSSIENSLQHILHMTHAIESLDFSFERYIRYVRWWNQLTFFASRIEERRAQRVESASVSTWTIKNIRIYITEKIAVHLSPRLSWTFANRTMWTELDHVALIRDFFFRIQLANISQCFIQDLFFHSRREKVWAAIHSRQDKRLFDDMSYLFSNLQSHRKLSASELES